MEKEKMQVGLDIDVQKLEADKLRKGKKKDEEDLYSLKTDYKKLCLSIRTAEVEKTSEQLRLKARVAKLEKSLHQYHNRNSTIEMKVSLNKIEELERKIEELKITLQNLKQTTSSGKSNFTVLKVRSGIETISWVKLWLKYDRWPIICKP
ncbi:hypothetical protein PVK06_001110 [Gossypium arboreum]|uniref:Uncharacterized protein n=1 Tax=Gossypium arboreum TaxID=29729 RepID=A0ABR0R069_GOSAR|nr:hypothetical protein PVK06_001110 [Gossypium arboreum]